MKLIRIIKLAWIVFAMQLMFSGVVFGESLPGTAENPYRISTAEELFHFADVVNGNADGVEKNSSAHAILMADIIINEQDLSGGANLENVIEWTPAGNSIENIYTGEFDGNGYEIQGMYVKSGTARGLFGYVGGKIKNLKVTKSYINAVEKGCCAGMIAGKTMNAIVSNCQSGGFISGGNYVNFGGIIGFASATEISNCQNYSTVSNENDYDYENIGGIAGVLNEGSKVSDCENYGLLYLISNEARHNNTGGICGISNSSSIINCKNENKVTSYGRNNFIGGIVGVNENCSVVADSENNQKVVGYRDDCIGGIAGENNNAKISGCVNNAEFGYNESFVSMGGIAAYNKNNGIISDCRNTSYLKGVSNNIAGIVTYLLNATVEKCVNEGLISGNRSTYISGIAAQMGGNATVKNCYNVGNITNINGGTSCGIVAGAYGSGNKIENCYNTGAYSSAPITAAAGIEVLNCYYLQNIETDSVVGTTFKTAKQFESGEVCYLLNGNNSNDFVYYQNIGTDKTPSFCGKKVYYNSQNGYCNTENEGELTFSENGLVTGGAKNSVVLIAGYSAGKMVYIKTCQLSGDINMSMMGIIKRNDDIDEYCAFLWSGYEDLRPLCRNEGFKVTTDK